MNRRFLLRWTLTIPAIGLGAIGLGVLAPLTEAWATEAWAQAQPAGTGSPPRLVMIDPGHGGHDPGAIGGRGTCEKDVTLDIALAMARHLDGSRGVVAQLTRDRDEFLPLRKRVARARDAKADLFLSIHADSAPNHDLRGLSAYTLSEKASDDFASALARRENLADGVEGIDPGSTGAEVAAILVDLTVRHTRQVAMQARGRLVSGAGRSLRLLEQPIRSADFAVLKAPDVPSVLIELGFLSNPDDEERLRSGPLRQDIAAVLAGELAGLMTGPPFT